MSRDVDPLLTEIDRLRLERGLSVCELEQAAGLGYATYRAAQRRGNCTLYTIRALYAVFGLDIIPSPRSSPNRARPLVPCGTPTAARRHWARGERLCAACRDATRAYDADRKRTLRQEASSSEPTPGTDPTRGERGSSMTAVRSAQAPGFIRGVSASWNGRVPGALAQSGYDRSATFHELGFRQIVLEGVDEPVAPDAVIGVHQVAATAARDAVVKTGVHARYQLDARVVAAEALRLQFCPHGVVLIALESVPPQAALKPVIAAVVAGVCGRPRAHLADTRAALSCPPCPIPVAPAVLLVSAARSATLEGRASKLGSAPVAGRFVGCPLRPKRAFASRGPRAVLSRARPAQHRSPVRAAIGSAIFTESISNAPRLGRFISHRSSVPPADALRCSLRRWCETSPHLVREGDRR